MPFDEYDGFKLPPSIEDGDEPKYRAPTPPPAYASFSRSPSHPTGLRRPSSRLPSYVEAAAPTVSIDRTSVRRNINYNPYGDDDADTRRVSQDLELALAFPYSVECPRRYGTFLEDGDYDDDREARLRRSETAPSLFGPFVLAIFCSLLCIGIWMVALFFIASKTLPDPRVPSP